MDIETRRSLFRSSSSSANQDNRENESLNPPQAIGDRDTPSGLRDWSMCGERVPKNQVTFIAQIIAVYGIIIVSIVHISLQSANQELWLVLLSSAFGYILPSPGLKFLKKNGPEDSALGYISTTTTDSVDCAGLTHGNDETENKS